MTRELLVALTESEVVATCEASDVSISVVERIPAGGTRLVCMSGFGAATMRRVFKGKIIEGQVIREKIRPNHRPW